MGAQNEEIPHHLKEAMGHLEAALNLSIQSLKEGPQAEQHIGHLWEDFLGSMFGQIREKGKENKLNLLNLISFSNITKHS